MTIDTTKREPDFVNASGIKWWLHDGITKYAHTKGLPETYRGWKVEEPSGVENYVITNSSGVVAASQSLDAIGIKIDMFARMHKELRE